MTDHCHERRGQNDRAERPANGFVWTCVRNKFSMTEQMTTDVGKDVIQFHGEDDQQQDRPIVPIICHVAKVTERAPAKSESEHPEPNAWDVAFRLIRNYPANGNQ